MSDEKRTVQRWFDCIARNDGDGEFALFADDVPPKATIGAPTAGAAAPYSRWSITAAVTEKGSGVDASASGFVVDQRRVPTEWDPEAGVLRWKPRQRPAPGPHTVEVVVRDRAGQETRVRGRFTVAGVLPSRTR